MKIRITKTVVLRILPSRIPKSGSQLLSWTITRMEETMTKTTKRTPIKSPSTDDEQSAKIIMYFLWPSAFRRFVVGTGVLGGKSSKSLWSPMFPILFQRTYQIATTRMLN